MDFDNVERTKWIAHDSAGYAPVALDDPSFGDYLEAIRFTVDVTAFDALLLAYKQKCAELADCERLVSELKDPNCS